MEKKPEHLPESQWDWMWGAVSKHPAAPYNRMYVGQKSGADLKGNVESRDNRQDFGDNLLLGHATL
ncbi:Hypothetical predicted protein [Podarcis lilfordi]|uniref:Uncharacterized protein n=1 Tax=Podarcis lilfordi TaxID=74358 RepID=A0AA35PGX1_9SAUR|nr:Hypothetical predicted protein [Podarcis lilfordi]